VADRGYYASEEIRACEEAGITVTLPKPSMPWLRRIVIQGPRDWRSTVRPW